MRKGEYKSNLGGDVVVTIRVVHDMTDAEFEHALGRAMEFPMVDTQAWNNLIGKLEEV